jgi:hypothetical protein
MRPTLALVFVAPLIASCTPYIPVRDDFATSAAAAKGDIPPEFAAFNAYDPAVNGLLTDQICATPYQPRDVAVATASPGEIVTTQGRCATHVPVVGSW